MGWWNSGPIWFGFVRRSDSYAIIQIWRLNHFRILLNYRRKILLNDQKCRAIVFFIRICLQKNLTGDLDGINPDFALEFWHFWSKTLNKWFYLTFRWRNRWWNFVADVPNRIPETYFKRNASGIRINHLQQRL